MVSIMEMKDVRLIRGTTEILKNVQLKIPAGKTSIIIGPAGCGKSSLIKCLAGILLPSSGSITFEGRNLDSLSDREQLAYRKKTGFVFQDSALWSNKNVHENLLLPIVLHNPGISSSKTNTQIEELVKTVGYQDSLQLRPAQLSSGENKLVAFARAIANDPEILFLDYPTSGIDSESTKRINALISKYRRSEKTLVITTHDSNTLSSHADYLIAMANGEIIEQGSFPQILSSRNQKLREILTEVMQKADEDSEARDLLDLMNTSGLE